MDEGYRTQSIPYTMCSWIRFDGKDIKWMKVIGLKVYLTLCVAGSGSMGRT